VRESDFLSVPYSLETAESRFYLERADSRLRAEVLSLFLRRDLFPRFLDSPQNTLDIPEEELAK
jgi:hypothetical protein